MEKKFVKPKSAAAAAASSDDIFKAPIFTRDPTNKQMKLGQKLILRVEATGVPAPSFQWFHNGIKIPGAVNNSFVIVKTRGNNHGAYTCEAKNFVGSVMSKPAMISFYKAEKLPELKIEPELLYVALGKPGKFSLVGVTEEELKEVTLKWLFNGKKISGAAETTLQFSEVKKKYEGEYKLIATKNAAMVASNTVRLVVDESAESFLGKEELSFADELLIQEMPSISLVTLSRATMKIPPVLPPLPKGAAKTEEDDLFFDPDELGDDQLGEEEDDNDPCDDISSIHELSVENKVAIDPISELFAQQTLVQQIDTSKIEALPSDEKLFETLALGTNAESLQSTPEDMLLQELTGAEGSAHKEVASPSTPYFEIFSPPEEESPVETEEMETLPQTEPAAEAAPVAAPIEVHEPAATLEAQVDEKPKRSEEEQRRLIAKKEFLERLLQSIATFHQNKPAAPQKIEDPLARKIARQREFLMKLKENVLKKTAA